MRFLRIAVTFAALLSTMGCTQEFMHEYEIEQTDLGAEGGYAIVAAGYADQVGEPIDDIVTLDAMGNVLSRDEPDWTGTVAYNARLGYQSDPWFSVEGAVSWEPNFGFEEENTGLIHNGEASLLKIGPQMRISIPTEAPIAPYLLAGVGYAWAEGSADRVSPIRRPPEVEEHGLYARAGVGIDGAIMEGWFWTVGGHYDMGFGDLDDVETWALLGGIGLKW